MKRRWVALLLLIVPLAAALAAPDDAAKFKLKPGAKGRACLGCHPDFADTLGLPFVHTPVKNGDCADCHNPHASRHGKLLAASPNAICVTCHAGIAPQGARSVHHDVVEGNCVKCHDPHASKNRGVLREAGNTLCIGCHKELGEKRAFAHAPVAKSCLGCHDPHAGKTTPSLLVREVPALCTGCHKPDVPAFRKAHLDYPVGGADCGSCHDPHGSSQPGILWASVHGPVRNRMCAQCHAPASSPEPLKVKAGGIAGCKGCHAQMIDAAFALPRLHGPVADRTACLNCHRPHAARAAKLLRNQEGRLCGECHAAVVQRAVSAPVKHPPVAEGNCSACHEPHASQTVFLLSGDNPTAGCSDCHDWSKHQMHPVGPQVIDPRNPSLPVDCLSCHRSHDASFKFLAHWDTKRELCVQCHADMGR
ncbi:MAG: cytochrome c3 family protein [Acidobacteria bacterium]|nr:cytochrome c3 family protein [Acidobacteriota bacterium]